MKEIINTLHNNQAASLYSVAAITTLILLCVSFQASAAGKDGESASAQAPSSKFNKLDSNQDGKLSREETAGDKALAGSFDALDMSADGTLDAKEYDAFTSAVQKK